MHTCLFLFDRESEVKMDPQESLVPRAWLVTRGRRDSLASKADR